MVKVRWRIDWGLLYWVLVELAGFGLLLIFLWQIWPPLVLAGAGLLMVTWANVRGVRR